MEIVAAIAVTASATATWIARLTYPHAPANPALVYLGLVLTTFAVFRWKNAFTHHNHVELLLITAVQAGIILLIYAGMRSLRLLGEAGYKGEKALRDAISELEQDER